MWKKPRNNPEVLDLISYLPDHILLFIICHLSIREICRTSVLSKRWTHLWKNVSHFDFDYNKMSKPRGRRIDGWEYAEIVNNTLQQHKGDLISCSFKHVPWCLGFGVLNRWIEFCMETKKLRSLRLHCVKQYKIMKYYFKRNLFSNLNSLELKSYRLEDSTLHAFESCKKLRILKLESIVIGDGMINGILKFCFALEKFTLIRSQGFNSIKIENKCLKTLEIFRLTIHDIFINVDKLKTLKLYGISLLDSTINKILKNCLGLENLGLSWLAGFDSIKIENKSLKTLQLIALRFKEIIVNAEALQDVVIDSLECSPKSLRIYSKNLRTFGSTGIAFDQSHTLKSQDILQHCSTICEFKHLTRGDICDIFGYF